MKMIIAISLCVLSVIGNAQEMDCSSFHKGKFYFTPPNGGEVSVKRSSWRQIERYNEENQWFIYDIEWLSECEYKLTLKRTVGVHRELKKQIIGTVLYCKVAESKLGHYKVYLSSNKTAYHNELTIYTK